MTIIGRVAIAALLFLLPAGTIWAGLYWYGTKKGGRKDEKGTNTEEEGTESDSGNG